MTLRHFTVIGKGSFPFELLYRCECWPASVQDAERMLFACPTVAPEQRITLATAMELSGVQRGEWSLKKWPIAGNF